MTAATTARMADTKALVPARGTGPIAANTLLYRMTLVSANASGYLVAPTDGDGFDVQGYAEQTYDNRTGSQMGGLDGSEDIDIGFGGIEVSYTGTAPKRGQKLFVVDNQTVSTSSNGGLRGRAGYASEPGANGRVILNCGPAALASFNATQETALLEVPLGSLRLSTGAAIAAFAAGSADGFALVDSEAFGIRWNDDVFTTIAGSVALPRDLDDTADLTVHLRGFRVGSSDTTAAITFGAFFQTDGAAHTADANAGGASTAFDGATTIVTNETVTIAAADVPASPSSMTFTLVPTAALDDDDLVLLGITIEYTRKAG